MKIKKILIGVLAAVLATSAAACGGRFGSRRGGVHAREKKAQGKIKYGVCAPAVRGAGCGALYL